MKYNKIAQTVEQSTAKEKPSKISLEQIDKIRTISGRTLAILGVAGIVAVAIVAPNLLAAIETLMKLNNSSKKLSKKEKISKLERSFYYLKKSGLIKFRWSRTELKVFLTELGKKKLERLNLDSLNIKKPNNWNGKWWQVAADVPTRQYRQGADQLRGKLKDLSFYPLQRTLWLYPYDPRKEIEFIINSYGIDRFVTVMEINRLDKQDEENLIKFFKENSVL